MSNKKTNWIISINAEKAFVKNSASIHDNSLEQTRNGRNKPYYYKSYKPIPNIVLNGENLKPFSLGQE
jgi:hypothetical protein